MHHYMYSWSLNISLRQVHVLLNSDWTTTCTTEQWMNHYMDCWTMTEPLHVLLNNDWITTCTTEQWLNLYMYSWSVTKPLPVLLISDWTPPCTTDQWLSPSMYYWSLNEPLHLPLNKEWRHKWCWGNVSFCFFSSFICSFHRPVWWSRWWL